MKCTDLPKPLPNFDWEAYLTLRLPSEFRREIGDIECRFVNVTSIKNYGAVMEKVSRRTLANYLMYRYVRGEAIILSIADRGFEDRKDPPTCMNYVYDVFKYAFANLYVQRRFGTKEGLEKFRDGVRTMIHNIREAYVDRVKKKKHVWMDEKARQQTIKQLNRIKHVIAADDIHFDEAAMNEYYETLRIKADDDFVSMHFAVEDWRIRRQLADALYHRNALSYLALIPTEPAALYNPVDRHIAVSAAMLMPPHYDPLFPLAVNYGDLGYTLTHEMTHALDCLRFDDDPEISWDVSISQKYYQLMWSFVAQYYSFFDPHLNEYVDGKRTVNENIADNVLHITYEAYKKALQARDIDGEEFPLPGLEDYTMDQIFFIRYAQFHCKRFADVTTARVHYENDTHAPSTARVHIPIQNSWSLFQSVFQCPPDAKLWPTIGDKPVTW